VATRTSHSNKKAKQRIYPENILVTVLTVVATIFQVTNKFAQHKENHVVRVESSTIFPKFAAVHQCESQNFVHKTGKSE
jgi:hypothetical protein